MDVFCDRLKFGSTAALDCRAGQNKDKCHKKELLMLPVSFSLGIMNSDAKNY